MSRPRLVEAPEGESPEQAVMRIAAAKGITYRTPPFPPGDRLEPLRLNFMRVLQAESETALDRANPEVLRHQLAAWYAGQGSTVTLAPGDVRWKIGRTEYRWRLDPPTVATAAAVDAWFRRFRVLEILLSIVSTGSAAHARDALAFVLWEYRHEIVEPSALKGASAATIAARFPERFKAATSLSRCVARVRNRVSRKKGRSAATV